MESALWPADYARNGAAYPFLGTARTRHLEIGCGNGLFLSELSARFPDAAIVGIELDPVFAHKGIKRLARGGNATARITPGDARQLLIEAQEGLEATFDHVWLNFPDPWPKDRHAKNRLSQPSVLQLIAAVCAPDGELHLATDDERFFVDFSASAGANGFIEAEHPRIARSAIARETRYQQRWKEEGRTLWFRDFRRVQERMAIPEPRYRLEEVRALAAIVPLIPLAACTPVGLDRGDWSLRSIGQRMAHGGVPVARYVLVNHRDRFSDRFDFDANGQWTNARDCLPTRQKIAALRDLTAGALPTEEPRLLGLGR